MSDIVLNVRPAAVRGPVTSGVARVVADSQVVVVVTGQGTRQFAVLSEPVVTAPGKWQFETDHGLMTVVKSGGCTCGKPWMTKETPDQLVASARASLNLVEA